MSPLACRDLACGYHGGPVLEGLSFELASGSVTALLGPNGSGKSTLLKTLVRTLRPLAGEAFVEGKPLSSLSDADLARCVAFVPQEEDHRFPFTAREVVVMGRLARSRSLFDTPEDRVAGEDALRRTDCLDLADRPVTELSGGERQRVLIARALAQGTRILLLDEPTSHLDVSHVVDLVRLIRAVATEGYTVLVAVHDLNVASAVADRALLLANGRLVLDGSPAVVLADPVLDEVYRVPFAREAVGSRVRVHPPLF
ncbi:MAG: ABC transporter ATP-binding protein [Fimbriimonadaceae bacterium]|nr:ABC transporter ATP-binding protein [Fimbriimonadaceae bacterium]